MFLENANEVIPQTLTDGKQAVLPLELVDWCSEWDQVTGYQQKYLKSSSQAFTQAIQVCSTTLKEKCLVVVSPTTWWFWLRTERKPEKFISHCP